MKKAILSNKSLFEKRPPLYIYRAKWGGKEVFLNEIIPYISAEEETKREFLEIVEDFAKRKHKNISPVLNIEKKGVRILIIEEFKEGENLKDFIERKEPFDSIGSMSLISSITKAILKFHSKSIFGLGIEPQNIIISDLNTITIIHPLLPIIEKYFKKTEKPEILNPSYLSPEQIRENAADERSDLFTIGILLFEIINHTYPFRSDSYELLDFEEKVPYCLRYITERLLNVDPSERFGSVNDFLEDLNICKKEIKTERVEKRKLEKATPKEEEIMSTVEENTKEEPHDEIEKEEKLKEVEKATPKEEKAIEESEEMIEEKEKVEEPEEKIIKKVMDGVDKEKKEEIAEAIQTIRPSEEKIARKKTAKSILSIRNLTIAGILILLLLLIIFIPRFIRLIHPFEISTFSINNNVVEANDKDGNLLWKFKTGSDISFSKTIDIDNDKRKEVVLGTGFLLTNEQGEKLKGRDNARLYILNENGKVLFSKDVGMPTIYPEGSSQWTIYDIQFLDIDNDMLTDFIALAVTDDSIDCIIFTKTQKDRISKFWHTGKIRKIILFTLSNEKKQLICGATNSRMGEKPVIFALDINEFFDQSPPWGGDLKNKRTGLLWYRFLPGGGSLKRIEEKDSTTFLVEADNGIKKYYRTDGFEIIEEDTTEEMINERGEKFLECFREFEKAKDFYRRNDLESALTSLNNSINLKIEENGLTGSLYYEKGMLLYGKKMWKSSSIAFNDAVKIDPLFYEAFLMNGIVYAEMERFKNASSSFKTAHKLSGKESYFYRMVDCYVTLGNYQKAEGLLRDFEKYSEEKGLFLLERAKVAREVGNFKSASRFYEKLTVLEPKNLKAYISLADAYADMNENIEKADSLFAFSCKMDSSLFYENIETLAWILYRKSHFEEALQNINIAVDRESSRKATSVLSRRKLPRIYYRKAIIAQTRGEKTIKEEAIKNSLSSQFCKGYIRKQINYLLGSPK